MSIKSIKADSRVQEFNRVYGEDFKYEMVLKDGYIFDDGLDSSYATFDNIKEAEEELKYNIRECR